MSTFNLLRSTLRVSSLRPTIKRSLLVQYPKFYSTEKVESEEIKSSETDLHAAALEAKDKTIAELKDSRLRSLADFENLQKITTREKIQAKEFAIQSFAKDLISSIDILSLALNSLPPSKLTPPTTLNKDLIDLYQGVTMTKKEIENALKRHGVIAFNPIGEQFDPNKHEALYQAPIPGKTPGEVIECQEIGYMIKERLLRPAKVGVVLGSQD